MFVKLQYVCICEMHYFPVVTLMYTGIIIVTIHCHIYRPTYCADGCGLHSLHFLFHIHFKEENSFDLKSLTVFQNFLEIRVYIHGLMAAFSGMAMAITALRIYTGIM